MATTVPRPTLQDAARELRALGDAELERAADLLHRAFFADDHASREQFLLALLRA